MKEAPSFPALAKIDIVRFFKRDEITTDLICCEIITADTSLGYHEEMEIWRWLIDAVEVLPGFDTDWYAKVSQPPFKTSLITAFERVKNESVRP